MSLDAPPTVEADAKVIDMRGRRRKERNPLSLPQGPNALRARVVRLEQALAQCYVHRHNPDKIRQIITQFRG